MKTTIISVNIDFFGLIARSKSIETLAFCILLHHRHDNQNGARNRIIVWVEEMNFREAFTFPLHNLEGYKRCHPYSLSSGS